MNIKMMDIVEITDTMYIYKGVLIHETYVESDLGLAIGYRCKHTDFLTLKECINYIDNV
jgi:hypothetical protein